MLINYNKHIPLLILPEYFKPILKYGDLTLEELTIFLNPIIMEDNMVNDLGNIKSILNKIFKVFTANDILELMAINILFKRELGIDIILSFQNVFYKIIEKSDELSNETLNALTKLLFALETTEYEKVIKEVERRISNNTNFIKVEDLFSITIDSNSIILNLNDNYNFFIILRNLQNKKIVLDDLAKAYIENFTINALLHSGIFDTFTNLNLNKNI